MDKNGSTVKKTYNLPEGLIARVRRILRAKTETEAIIRALERVAWMEEVERALRATAGKIPKYRPIR